VFTTSGTYPRSFVTQIFHNGQCTGKTDWTPISYISCNGDLNDEQTLTIGRKFSILWILWISYVNDNQYGNTFADIYFFFSLVHTRASEFSKKWVSDCCLTSTDEIHFYLNNTLSWICIVQSHLNNSPRVDMFSNTDTLSWCRVNQFLIFLDMTEYSQSSLFNSMWDVMVSLFV
jgi:hypothetical protein